MYTSVCTTAALHYVHSICILGDLCRPLHVSTPTPSLHTVPLELLQSISCPSLSKEFAASVTRRFPFRMTEREREMVCEAATLHRDHRRALCPSYSASAPFHAADVDDLARRHERAQVREHIAHAMGRRMEVGERTTPGRYPTSLPDHSRPCGKDFIIGYSMVLTVLRGAHDRWIPQGGDIIRV